MLYKEAAKLPSEAKDEIKSIAMKDVTKQAPNEMAS